MKKLVALAAAAALLLAGCQKQAELPSALVFTSDKPAFADETRTAWDGQTIVWEAGDAISLTYRVDGAYSGSFYASDPLASGGQTARFVVPFDGPQSGEYAFLAVYPQQPGIDFSDAPIAMVTVPVVQTPRYDSFDPAADLLVGRTDQTYSGRPSGEIPLRWSRVTAHGDLTLKNLSVPDGEILRRISFEAQKGADLVGAQWLDLADEVSVESFAPTGDNLIPNVVVVDPVSLSLSQDGSLHVWVSILPETLTDLTVTVETDKARYVKSFSGIEKTFRQNARNLLGINMSGAERISTEPVSQPTEYTLVTSAPSNWEGDYLIVYTPDGIALSGVDSSRGTAAGVTISDGKIAYSEGRPYNVKVEKSGNGYSLLLGSTYLGLSSSSNALNGSDAVSGDGFRWTLRVSDGHVTATNLEYPTRILKWNKSASTFRCYTSGQLDVDFYRLDGTSSGQGGGETPVQPSVTTGDASGITTSSAVLGATYTGDVTYGGFQFGTSESFGEDQQADFVSSGSFSVQLDALGDGITYYYRAYIAVLEGSTYQFYYGQTRSFTTRSAGATTTGDQPGWFEVPLMNIQKSGSYLVNASDPNQYYAWHICAGGEKAAGGRDARNFTVCFSAKDHCPLWVAAPLHSMFRGSGRHDAYKNDPKIPANLQYGSKSTGGNCNKGHMLGSADRNKTVATNHQVFYYSNIAPQLSSGFNTGGGGWNTLEDWVDGQYCADTLYAVIGCYFDKFTDGYGYTVSPSKIQFGQLSDVSMPTMFYYVLLRTKSGATHKSVKDCSASELKCAAFVRAHTNALKGQDVTSREMMSVAELERITGFTYFPNVPNAPKETCNASDWGL